MDTCSVRGDTVSQTNVLSFARINVMYLPELGGQLPPLTPRPVRLCSPVPMFPGTYVPRTYVPQYLCSPVPMFPDLRLMTAVHHLDYLFVAAN